MGYESSENQKATFYTLSLSLSLSDSSCMFSHSKKVDYALSISQFFLDSLNGKQRLPME